MSVLITSTGKSSRICLLKQEPNTDAYFSDFKYEIGRTNPLNMKNTCTQKTPSFKNSNKADYLASQIGVPPFSVPK